MEQYAIVFAPTALQDIEESLEWLAAHTPVNLSEWLAALKADINTLSQLPERCPYAPENGLWGEEELRQLVFQRYASKYRVIYSVCENTVQILSIRHGSRRYLHDED